MNQDLARKALKAARRYVKADLDDIIDGYTVGGREGHKRGEPMSTTGVAVAKSRRTLLRKIDKALESR